MDDAIDISGDDELLAVTRVGVSSFKIPKGMSPMRTAICLPLMFSVDSLYHKEWPLKSPKIKEFGVACSKMLVMSGT